VKNSRKHHEGNDYMTSILRNNMTILFQGDSITDCGRREEPCGIGHGYVHMLSARLWARYPSLDLKIFNRGISGDRAIDLDRRWNEDCIKLKPGLLSILIGVNDTWRRYDNNDPTSVERFHRSYHSLLTKTREQLPECKIVLCEPFLLPYPEGRKAWREDLDPKIHVVRELAREFAALLVSFDGVFAAASAIQPCKYWAEDGVHPTIAGHGLMADAWWDTVIGS
jgi:acyl-CoA thioesterase I